MAPRDEKTVRGAMNSLACQKANTENGAVAKQVAAAAKRGDANAFVALGDKMEQASNAVERACMVSVECLAIIPENDALTAKGQSVPLVQQMAQQCLKTGKITP